MAFSWLLSDTIEPQASNLLRLGVQGDNLDGLYWSISTLDMGADCYRVRFIRKLKEYWSDAAYEKRYGGDNLDSSDVGDASYFEGAD